MVQAIQKWTSKTFSKLETHFGLASLLAGFCQKGASAIPWKI